MSVRPAEPLPPEVRPAPVTSPSLRADLCLVPGPRHVDAIPMSSDIPLYRQICSACPRPAVTLDADGAPACSDHADAVRKAPDLDQDDD